MSNIKTALLVIDVQESFRHRDYWTESDLQRFVHKQQSLIDGAKARSIPIVQILHIEETGVFSENSGLVKTLQEISIEPDVIFKKQRHSALIGTGLEVWLIQNGIRNLIISGIRTEQCCETTTRHAADLGFDVDYVTEATLTFPMTDAHNRSWSAAEIAARTELVLADRFARITDVSGALTNA
jgi:nicotinamidase-related amidase